MSTKVLEPELLAWAGSHTVIVDAEDFIKTEFIEAPGTAEAVQGALGNGKVFLFTSANAVRAVAKCPAAKVCRPESVFCIGRATLEAVKKLWAGVTIGGTADNALDLAELVLNAGVSSAVFFCGMSRLDALPDRLTKQGVELLQIPVYRTVETPVLCKHTYQAVLFYSPSGVRSFFSVNEASAETIFFAIGDTTAKAIRSRSRNQIVKSDSPDKKRMLAQAVSYFSEQK